MTMFQRKRIKEFAEEIGAKAESRTDSLLTRLVRFEGTWFVVLAAVGVILMVMLILALA